MEASCPHIISLEKVSVLPESPLDDLYALEQELPYWMKEVYGKPIIDRLKKFVIASGGAQSWEEIKSRSIEGK